MGTMCERIRRRRLEEKRSARRFKWYFRSDSDPYAQTKEEAWCPYSKVMNELIEDSYYKYLVSKGFSEGMLELNDEYLIDFRRMVQINKADRNKLRPVGRFLPENEGNLKIFRPDNGIFAQRYYYFEEKNNNEEVKFIKKVKSESVKIFGDKKIFIPKEIKDTINFNMNPQNYTDLIQLLINEMEEEANFLNSDEAFRLLDIYKIKLKGIDESNVFSTIINLYSIEGYIFRRLNKILRDKDYSQLQKLRNYYFSLNIALDTLSIPPQKNNSNLYRSITIDPNSPAYDKFLSFYKQLNKNDFIIYYEFLSTTYDLQRAKGFGGNILLKINLPSEFKELSVPYIENYSDYKSEKEVLLGSGTILQFQSMIENKALVEIELLLMLSHVQSISSYLLRNLSVITLYLSDQELEDEGMKLVSSALAPNKNLKVINLDKNNISEKGCKYLSEYLKTNENLTALYMNENKMGDKGCQEIMESLVNNESLITISIEKNEIKPEGALHVSMFLKANKSIKELFLGDNKLGDEGIVRISEGIVKAPKLESLGLSNNNINNKGMRPLMNAVIKNETIKNLNLDYNQFDLNEAKKLTSKKPGLNLSVKKKDDSTPKSSGNGFRDSDIQKIIDKELDDDDSKNPKFQLV